MENAFLRLSQITSVVLILPRYKAVYFGKECDSQSQCAKTAREIVSLLEKKKNIPHQNTLIKEEIWKMLDHESLLSEFGCYALATLTLREVLRIMVKHKVAEELLVFVEEMDTEMLKIHAQKPFGRGAPNIQALKYKHMGQGMDYLKEMHKCNLKP